MTLITVELPDELAEQARRAGLLSAQAIGAMLVDVLQWRSHDAHVEAIRQALIEGEQSGEPQPFDATAFRQRMLADG